MTSHLFWVAGTAYLGTVLVQGDETFTWDSPHHLYRAVQKQDYVHQISDTQITSLTEPTARPIFEGGGGSAAPILSPTVSGFWSDDDRRLILVSGGKTDSGDLSLGCQIIEKDPQTSRFIPKSRDYQPTPDPVEQEAADRLFAMHPKSKSNIEGKYSLLSCRWIGDRTLETENQLDVSVQDSESHNTQQYRARWATVVQVTDKGFVTTSVSPISCAELDAKSQPGKWQTLSETDQDRLRVAVRLGQEDKIKDLLTKGVNPNAFSDISLLSIAIGKDEPAIVDNLLKGGADVNLKGSLPEPPLDVAMMSRDGHIFDLIMAAHPKPSHDVSEDAYFDLYGGLGRNYGATQLLDPATDPGHTAGSALVEFGRRLAVLEQAGFLINTADNKTGDTILMTVVKDRASLAIIQKLVGAGADPLQRNKAGKSSADLAADANEINVLRLLDVDHSHAAVLYEHEIPAGSPFIGAWSRDDGMGALELKSDGSGFFAGMAAFNVSWMQKGDMAILELVPMKGKLPNGDMLTGEARLTADGKRLNLALGKKGNIAAMTEELARSHD